MSHVAIRNLEKTYPNGVQAVRNFNMEIGDGEFVVLLGPSGCGKSTILMMIAGLEEITSGELYFDDVCVNAFTPKERDIGLVFQSYALLPNMNVYDNIGFGLTIRRMDKKEKDRRIRRAAEILDLEDYLDRRPRHLSGGQKQRVAIGRCIVRDPKVFLFDEPLSNLDAKLRGQMRKELIKLHKMLNATMIYVTHDQIEAMTMADRIVVMRDGEVQQIGTPEEVYENPENLFVAAFIGSPGINFFDVRFEAAEAGGRLVLPCGQAVPLPEETVQKLHTSGKTEGALRLAVRPECITPAAGPEGIVIEGEITMTEVLGAERYVYFSYFGDVKSARTAGSGKETLRQKMRFRLNTDSMLLFDPVTGKNILL